MIKINDQELSSQPIWRYCPKCDVRFFTVAHYCKLCGQRLEIG